MEILVNRILTLMILDALVQPSKLQTPGYVSEVNPAVYNYMKANNMTKHIRNKAHKVLIMEQLVYCSSQSLCSIGSVSSNVNDHNCCAPCSCEDSCTFSGNCCLDKALAENSLDILSRKGSSCVLPQLKPFEVYSMNTDEQFLMIGLCQPGFMNASIIRKCQIGQSSPNDTYIKNDLPVFSVLTNETYRNRFCAYCNLEQDSNLIYWETSFSCKESLSLFPQTAKELLEFIIEDDYCNIFYHPPPGSMSFPCKDQTSFLSECNVTGAWAKYDSSLDWACKHYDHPYEVYSEYYKNVFCYICNANALFPPPCFGGYTDQPSSITGLTSFEALFNFIDDIPIKQPEETTHLCPTGFRFDTYKNICREITCLPPFKYGNDVCENIFRRIASQRYEVFLRFNKAPSFYTSCDICSQLSTRIIQSYTRTYLKTMGYYMDVCGMSVLYTDDGCSLTNTDYLIIHVELYIEHFHDPITVAEQFLNSSAFQLKSPSGETLCIERQPTVMGGKFYEMETGKTEYDYVSPLDRTYIDPSNGKKLNVDIYPETFTCVFKPRVARLVPTFICPLVNISLSDYNITRHNMLCLDNLKICFKPEDFIFSDNNMSALICADSYFESFVSKYKTAREGDFVKELVSLVFSSLSILCLIVTMVTYILFPVLRTLPGIHTMVLCGTLIVAHALFTFGAGAVQVGFGCEVLGIIIHLTMLASVFLMNVCSIHMYRVFNHLDRQFILREEEKRRNVLISLLYSYGTSALFVIGRIVYSVVTTGKSGYGIRVCFINNPIALLFTFTLPVMLLVIANIVMFCIVIVKVSQLPDMSKSSTCRHHQKRFFIYIKLSSLTGVAWLFGFIAEISHSDVFVYLYIILIAGQGVFIMLSFVCNKRVYKLYSSYRKRTSGRSTSTCHTILDNTLSNSSDYKPRKAHSGSIMSTEIQSSKYHPTIQDNLCHESSTKL